MESSLKLRAAAAPNSTIAEGSASDCAKALPQKAIKISATLFCGAHARDLLVTTVSHPTLAHAYSDVDAKRIFESIGWRPDWSPPIAV